MDKRLKQVEEKKEDAALVEVGEDKYIIKVDKVSTDNAYKESVIYNLVQKLSYLDEMKRGYNDALEKVETYPPWIKYYVHLQYLVPVTFTLLGYMKYKKVLSLNTGFAVICTATIANEFAKTIKMKKIGGEKARKYEEHDANYSNLMSVYTKDVNFFQVCKYVLGVKITRELVDWRKYSVRDDLTNDFLQSTYY